VAHRIAPRAEADLDDIWVQVARESGSMEVASRLIDALTERFYLLTNFPQAGRKRDAEFGFGVRSFPVGAYIILYLVEGGDVLILRVVHGSRDFEGLIEF
jgi:toxin ParE1/3/4